MADRSIDDIRRGALDRMERQARGVRLAILGAAAVEFLLLIGALVLIDWGDRTHLLVLVVSVLGYTTVGLGLVALGAHVSQSTSRVVAVLEAMAKQ